MRRLSAVVLLWCLIWLPAKGAAAAVEEAGVGIRLLEAPSDRREDPRARSYIVDHVSPGTTITRRFEVSNGTSQRVDISVYAGPAELEHGAFRPLPQTETNELVTWTDVDLTSLSLAPGQKAPATVTIAVPADASPGERYGAVWAQLSSQAVLER